MLEDQKKTLIAFGVGVNFYSYIERLDQVCNIAAFCDNDSRKWGQYLTGDERVCISPQFLKNMEAPFVCILAERKSSVQAIEEQCDTYGIPHQRVRDFLDQRGWKAVECHWPQNIQRRRIHKFIELLIHGTTECNFHCEYCYVWRKEEFTSGKVTSEYTPGKIREALSMKKTGGPCHINACALGETLFSKDIVELCHELLEEGHYLSVITNGTVTRRIQKILQFPERLLERMFFKLSFHYGELKRRNLLETFWKNVDAIKYSPCSYSLEITPCDSLIQDIPAVKSEFIRHAGGAMPHITFTRDGNKEGLDLLSELSLKEYKETWGIFDSELFRLKCGLYKKKICQNCYAGNWSYRINAVNGNLQSCYRQELQGTIFDQDQRILPLLTVGQGCRLEYCFNNHAFLAWGDVPEVLCSDYFGVRDRIEQDSSHWVKEPYAAAMKQKLYDNNFQYIGRWPDYEKLFAANRKPAFILFNSPDYDNLGDHAIALAVRKMFGKLFPDIDLIEISCDQYIKENLLIRNVIQEEDILLVSGGGYLGSLWLWLEDLTKNIVQQYTRNKIILLPQTIYFEDSPLGTAEKQSLLAAFDSHSDLTVMLRDKASYELAVALFGDKVQKLLVPDIALSLVYEKRAMRWGSRMCFREDKEATGIHKETVKKALQEKGFQVAGISMVSEEMVCLSNREIYLNRLMEQVSHAEVVVTDRLHMMILCAVTNTPCIAFDNLSGKLSGTYQWLEGMFPVVFCEAEGQFLLCLEKVLSFGKTKESDSGSVEFLFEELITYIKGHCFT